MPKISQLPQDMPILNQALRDLQTAQGDIATLQSEIPGFVAYTPQVTALTGSFTSASATGRYAQINKLIFLQVVLTITTVGTGTSPIVSLPIAANGQSWCISGVEIASTGKGVTGQVGFNSRPGIMLLRYDDNGTPGIGTQIVLSGFYEAA